METSGSFVNPGSFTNEGVATVWLLATLGNGVAGTRKNNEPSNQKLIKKKDILGVSIPNTCDIINNNHRDLPLRHISSLLYGVTVCYSKKTEFFLNDLATLLSQLNCTARQSLQVRSRRVEQTIEQFNLESLANYTKVKGREFFSDKTFFLRDDKNYDIHDIRNYQESILGNHQGASSINSQAVLIRKDDYIRELTNWNDLPLINAEQSIWERNPTMEEIPIDMDFELDIDDVVSAKGSATPISKTSNMDLNDFNFEGDKNRFTPLNLDDLPNNNVTDAVRPHNTLKRGLASIDERQDKVDIRTVSPNAVNSPKRMRPNRVINGGLVDTIKIDTRISLLTETLRTLHEDYPRTMLVAQASIRGVRRKRENWESYICSSDDSPIINDMWKKLMTASEFNSLNSPVQRQTESGRAVNQFSISGSTMSSVRSTEVGRRAETRDFLGNLFQPHNNNGVSDDSDLINLEAREEDINDNIGPDLDISGFEPNATRSGDFLNVNLGLPPSSVGRLANRSSTNASGVSEEPDVVSALTRFRPGIVRTQTRGSGDSNDTLSENYSYSYERRITSEVNSLLSEQTRKFYDYVKEKALFDGELIGTEGMYGRKLTFESVVPSQKNQETSNDDSLVTKRVVAGAFFTLLTLASKEMVQLEVTGAMRSTAAPVIVTNQGEDIVILI